MPIADTPVCVFCRHHPMKQEHRPFCSERCRLQDLTRWADGAYRAASDATAGDDADPEQPEFKQSTPDHG